MRTRKLVAIIIIILLAFSLLYTQGWPRAGGGQKYRAPSRSSSSGSSSHSSTSSSGGWGSSGSNSSYHYDNHNYGGTSSSSSGAGCVFCGGGSCLGGIILIAIILIIIFVIMKKPKTGSKPEEPELDVSALPEINEEEVKGQLEELKRKDQFFSEKVFLDKAQTAFFEIQRAWSNNDLEPARNRMSEAQFNRMNMQLDEYKSKGWKNVVEDLVIGGVKIAEAGTESDCDFVKIRIHASLSDKTYDQSGKIVEGSKEIKPMAEYWTFIRKMGARTNEDGGRTISHNCPSCGAPVDAGESAKCKYCDATITTASFDWVLDCITQWQEEAYS